MLCLAAVGGAAGAHLAAAGQSCGNPQCNGLLMLPCATAGNASHWREIHDGREPTQIESAGGADGGCLNLYGGGEKACPPGTGVHRSSCGGNCFEWAHGQLVFGEAAGEKACSGLCAAVGVGGCVVVERCTSPQSAGWERVLV